MSANQRFSIAAFQAAEAGISDVVGSLRATYAPDNPVTCEGGVVTEGAALPGQQEVTFSASGALSGSYVYWMECEGDQLVGFSRGQIDMGEDVSPVTRIVKLYLQPPGEGISTDTYYGIKADGDIVLRGQNVINGNIHTNSNLTINNVDGEAVGAITATGTITTSDKDLDVVDAETGECGSVMCAVSGADSMFIEPAIDKINSIIEGEEYQPYIVDLLTHPDYMSCDIDLEGPQFGAIYYCSDGRDLDVSGNFNGATLLSMGKIIHRGRSDLGDYNDEVEGPDSVDTQLIAVGNIEMRGNDDSYVALWSDADVVQSGTSTLYGSIIAGGTVTRAGGINFSSWDSYEGITFNRVKRFGNILYWVELESN